MIVENGKTTISIDLEEKPNSLKVLDNSFEVAIGFESGNISLLSQDLKQLKFKTKISENKITSITPHLDDPHLFIGDNMGYIYSLNTISKKIDKLKTEHQNEITLSSIFSKDGVKTNEYILSHSKGQSIKTFWTSFL